MKPETNCVEIQTKCPCGAELAVKVRKPAPFRPEITKADCLACKSKFVIKTTAEKNREVRVHFAIRELSQQCKDLLQEKINERDVTL